MILLLGYSFRCCDYFLEEIGILWKDINILAELRGFVRRTGNEVLLCDKKQAHQKVIGINYFLIKWLLIPIFYRKYQYKTLVFMAFSINHTTSYKTSLRENLPAHAILLFNPCDAEATFPKPQ